VVARNRKSRHHDIYRLFNQVVRNYDFHFHLRQKIHRVLASPVNFGVGAEQSGAERFLNAHFRFAVAFLDFARNDEVGYERKFAKSF
jgi:hypothetical protein